MSKTVIVTGVTGQDGSHMVDYLLKNTDHNILGCVRRLSVSNYTNINHILEKKDPRFKLINLDLTDPHSIETAVRVNKPDFFINLAAQSFVGTSWAFPSQTFDTNANGVLHILEAIKCHAPECRLYNAGTSEEFGDVNYSPQDEKHPLKPRSPYGASKCAARLLIKVYRESFNIFAIQSWLFNHEGTRRGEEFVTRKISKGIARLLRELNSGGVVTPMLLGNLEAERDWMDAEDAIRAIWEMVNLDRPKEYVIGTGKTWTIKQFINEGLECAELKGEWSGEGASTKYTVDGKVIIAISDEFYRPAEVGHLMADNQKAFRELSWRPQTSFKELVYKMVNNDMNK